MVLVCKKFPFSKSTLELKAAYVCIAYAHTSTCPPFAHDMGGATVRFRQGLITLLSMFLSKIGL